MTTATAEASPATVEVGSFFECSWGYDQTNVDFYKVVEISPSGKTVKVLYGAPPDSASYTRNCHATSDQ